MNENEQKNGWHNVVDKFRRIELALAKDLYSKSMWKVKVRVKRKLHTTHKGGTKIKEFFRHATTSD